MSDFDARHYLQADHPGQAPCSWRYLGARCVLTHAHPAPHWLEVEEAMLPSSAGATKLLAKERSRGGEDDEE